MLDPRILAKSKEFSSKTALEAEKPLLVARVCGSGPSPKAVAESTQVFVLLSDGAIPRWRSELKWAREGANRSGLLHPGRAAAVRRAPLTTHNTGQPTLNPEISTCVVSPVYNTGQTTHVVAAGVECSPTVAIHG
jgi:hypothetical protein